MNFSMDPNKTQAAATPTTNTATGAPTGFTFGTTGAGDAGKSFGFNVQQSTATPQNKSLFGSVMNTPQPQNITFGTPTNTATVTPGAIAPPGIAPQAVNLSFGTTPTTNIGFSSIPAHTAPSFGTPTTSATGFLLPGFNLGGSTSTPSFGAAAASTAAKTPATTAAGTSFTFGSTTITPIATTTTATTGFNLGGATPAATTTASLGFVLGTTPAAPTTTGFTITTGATTASGISFSLGKPAASVAPSSLTLANTQATLSTVTTVTSSANANQPAAINFCQLEDSINKWTMELEEQEKAFVNQASQVNTWDKLLISNGEKIVTLNQEVERVKLEQQQLEHELDYVVGQQKELQDCLEPLEKELGSLSVSDPEREITYRLAEDLDIQLKKMSDDLKEIIELLNEANRAQDSGDPIVQIGKILNAHMNSLQYLDQQTTLLSQKIQQIVEMHQNFRQEHERSFNLAYN
ncbi:nuclear pore glycoprotein p62 [Prorops nasuta]|uniref:nuclear pore glycoprotein p62 n=1 Tax=Prorops nasuta TaxID=863751 RepID=UPI0034CDBD44